MPSWSKKPPKDVKDLDVDAFVGKIKGQKRAEEGFDYRRASLAIHPHVCARCGREFESSNLHLLTVHHKDGNHDNNPRDGSNWENLCVYCHEDEHSRETKSYNTGGEVKAVVQDEDAGPMGSLADKLKAALDKKK